MFLVQRSTLYAPRYTAYDPLCTIYVLRPTSLRPTFYAPTFASFHVQRTIYVSTTYVHPTIYVQRSTIYVLHDLRSDDLRSSFIRTTYVQLPTIYALRLTSFHIQRTIYVR